MAVLMFAQSICLSPLLGLGMVMGAELNAALVEVEDLGHDAIGRVDDVIIEKTGDKQ